MRSTKFLLLIVISSLMIGLFPVSAQEDDSCQIDMTEIINLANLSQQQADEGDLTAALETMALMRAEIDALMLTCTDGTPTNLPDFASIELPQTISVQDPILAGIVTLSYPADWFAEAEVNYIRLGNSEAALRASSVVDLAPGEAQINSGVYDAALADLMGIDLPDTPDEFISALMEYFNSNIPSISYEIVSIETFDANGRAAAISIGTSTYAGTTYPNMSAAVDVDGTFIFLGMFAGEGTDLSQYEALLLAIAASVEYEAPES